MVSDACFHPHTIQHLTDLLSKLFKYSMSKLQEGSIQDKVSRVLFYSHITPHSITGVSPAELLQNRRLRSQLDLLRPDIEVKVETKQQSKQQAYMNHNPTIRPSI